MLYPKLPLDISVERRDTGYMPTSLISSHGNHSRNFIEAVERELTQCRASYDLCQEIADICRVEMDRLDRREALLFARLERLRYFETTRVQLSSEETVFDDDYALLDFMAHHDEEVEA